MSLKKKVSRREFIRVSALSSAGLALAACAGTPPPEAANVAPPAAKEEAPAAPQNPQEASKEETTPAGKYQEAPMLAELVASGSLPAVDDRLPLNPKVLAGMETPTGNYGGTMRRGFKGVSDRWGPTKIVRQNLVMYDPELTLQPNLAESWETNDDATEWTFRLREGAKWSDGQSFTTDDFQWWYENVMLNGTLTPAISSRWVTGPDKEPMVMTFPDKTTVVFKFAHPYPRFGYMVADLTNDIFTPSHYMAQFHADTTTDKDALDKAVADAGFETWDQLFADRNWWYLNPDRPSMFSFLAKNPLSEELFIMERNPYFIQVDPEGKQLPYMDHINHRIFESNEVFDLWVIAGDIDYQQRHVAAGKFTVYKQNEEAGDYRVQIGVGDQHVVLTLNQTVKKPRLREFFQNRDVRIAVSLAVNRDLLNELAFDGLYTPRQYSPLEQSPQFYPKQANAYLDYDPDQANALLDEAGYAEKDSEGFRLHNDGSGETLSFVVEGTAQSGTPDEDAIQIIIKDLANVGIKATYKGMERSLYTEHWQANEIDAAFWGSGRSLVPIVDAAFFLGTGLDRPWGEAWGRWRLDPDHPAAEEPPADHWIRDIWALWDQILVEPDSDKQNELFFQILDIWAEELPQVGFLGQIPNPIIVKNGLRNLSPDYVYPLSNPTGHGGLIPAQSYYWDNPEEQS